MRRYFFEETHFTDTEVVLTGEQFKHICLVCRLDVGHRFEALNATGTAFLVELYQRGPKQAVGKILSSRQVPPLPQPHLHLALSLPKRETLEKVIEKCVEMGVKGVHVFESTYSDRSGWTKKLESKKERFQKILRGATQQTGRADLMELTFWGPVEVLLQSFAEKAENIGLLAYEGQTLQSFAGEVQKVRQAAAGGAVWTFVGAEGGFSEGDVKLFSNYGVIPCSLGPQVLRVETACVTLVSVLKYELGHFS